MSRHGDNFHESLVLVRAWGDAYPMGVIAGRHHQREPCRQYLSVVLANLCNFAQEREREKDLLEKGAMIGLGKGEPRGWPPSKLTTTDDEGSFLRAPSLYGVCCSRWGAKPVAHWAAPTILKTRLYRFCTADPADWHFWHFSPLKESITYVESMGCKVRLPSPPPSLLLSTS